MSAPRPSPTLALAAVLAVAAAAPGSAQAQDHALMRPSGQVADSAAVAATVHAYHEALQKGDTAAVRALLAPDIRVAESGGIETRDEYMSHHLPGDMAFAAAVTREAGPVHVTVVGDVAWAKSEWDRCRRANPASDLERKRKRRLENTDSRPRSLVSHNRR